MQGFNFLKNQNGFISKQKKQFPGSLTLNAGMETIPEKYGLDNDNLLIVTYISILVLN